MVSVRSVSPSGKEPDTRRARTSGGALQQAGPVARQFGAERGQRHGVGHQHAVGPGRGLGLQGLGRGHLPRSQYRLLTGLNDQRRAGGAAQRDFHGALGHGQAHGAAVRPAPLLPHGEAGAQRAQLAMGGVHDKGAVAVWRYLPPFLWKSHLGAR